MSATSIVKEKGKISRNTLLFQTATRPLSLNRFVIKAFKRRFFFVPVKDYEDDDDKRKQAEEDEKKRAVDEA